MLLSGDGSFADFLNNIVLVIVRLKSSTVKSLVMHRFPIQQFN
jgi:hypothetical protein